MTQGFVLTQYFYEQLIQFEKDPASLKDTIGEMVYSMDVDQQVHRARQIEFDKVADGDVLTTQQAAQADRPGSGRGGWRRGRGDGERDGAAGADGESDTWKVRRIARANFILARAALMTGIRRMRSTISRRPWPRARSRGCWPGRTFTWAACWTWIASATRPFPSTGGAGVARWAAGYAAGG
jgi:hypothetical protein